MTYEIDERRRIVKLIDPNEEGFAPYMPFDEIEKETIGNILDGTGGWSFITCEEARHLYAIARDELIERGLIEDES